MPFRAEAKVFGSSSKIMHPLIIGSLPELNNIGGIAIFVSRLLASSEYLNSNEYVFFSTKSRNPLLLIPFIYRSSFVHFNGCNPLAMVFIALMCFLFRKKLILSIHGQVGRSSRLLNIIEKYSIKLAYKPVVGIGSIKKASTFNKDSIVISSFIAPTFNIDSVVDEVISKISQKKIFCTNANSFVFDNNGNEIYGISYLINYFSKQEDSTLIVVDASGDYQEHYKDKRPPNVIFINEDIDFCYLLKKSDCFIRFTSTDGDSISIMESLFFNIPVIATDCIIRNDACILCKYANSKSLELAVDRFNKGDFRLSAEIESAEKYYDNLYKELSI